MCFILVHVGLRSVLVLLEKAYMGEDGVQLNSFVYSTIKLCLELMYSIKLLKFRKTLPISFTFTQNNAIFSRIVVLLLPKRQNFMHTL